MKVKRKDVLAALDAVMPGVTQGKELEQSNCFVFTKERVFTYNDEVAVSHPIKIGIGGAVPAKAFRTLLNKVKTDEVELTINKGELLLKGSKAKAGLRLETDVTLPLEDIGMPTKWIKLPEKFCDALTFCLFSASKDETKLILTNLHVCETFVESCDNYRITRYNMGKGASKAFPKELLIPAFAAKDIASNEPVEYATTEGWLHFRNEKDVTYSCRTFDDEYPDFSPFIAECEGDDVEFPETLNEILDRANVLSDGERVSLILEDGELFVATENESGWFEETCDVDYDSKPAEFDIQPEFMKNILKFKGTSTITDKMLRFDSDNFVHVVKLLIPKKK